MRRCTTALSALAAALFLAPTTPADVTVPPCAAAGLVAIVQPDATAAVPVGPAVTAATTQGAGADVFHDAQHAVDLTGAEAGAAGCVDSGGPGGTHAAVAGWSVLGNVLSGTGLRADLVPASGDGSGWRLRTEVKGLAVGGTPTDPIAGATVAVGDWGTLAISAQVELPRLQPLRYWAAALALRLTRAHAGLPAGTLVLVGYAAANRPPAPPPAPTTTVAVTTSPAVTTTQRATTTTGPAPTAPPPTTPVKKPAKHAPRKHHRPKARRHKRARRHAVTGLPVTGTPPLRVGGYVFPVAGGADWGDTYGAARSDVPGGWHHGDDLFAPLGTPVVAVAGGTVFAVGWNEVGGWRLWLADAAGNSFYYAHLSGYTKVAKDDRTVHRGDVLGFVGNTGDAFTTAPHLHFEVHPNPLLYLGYDGAVDPTTYLRAWPLARHVHVLPPVQLPSGAPSGFGSATDFRHLLAVHPLPAKPHAAAKPVAGKGPASPEAAGASAARATGSRRSSGEGSLPVVFAVVLLAAGLAAVAHSARLGRRT